MANKVKRVESLQEYLMRGGRIVVVPSVRPETDEVTVQSTGKHATGVASLLTLEEAEFFYGEPRSSKKQSKTSSQPPVDSSDTFSSPSRTRSHASAVKAAAGMHIDIDALPPELIRILAERFNRKE